MASSDFSLGILGPSVVTSRVSRTHRAATAGDLPSSVRFVFHHAELFDSAEVSGALALTHPYLLPSRYFDPVCILSSKIPHFGQTVHFYLTIYTDRPSDYTLTKLYRFTLVGLRLGRRSVYA